MSCRALPDRRALLSLGQKPHSFGFVRADSTFGRDGENNLQFMNARNLAIASSLLLIMGRAEDRYGPYGSAPTGNQVISAPNNATTGSATAVPEYSSAASETDQALVARIQQALSNGTLGFRPNLNVSARNGVVYLTGTVPNESARLSVDHMVDRKSVV